MGGLFGSKKKKQAEEPPPKAAANPYANPNIVKQDPYTQNAGAYGQNGYAPSQTQQPAPYSDPYASSRGTPYQQQADPYRDRPSSKGGYEKQQQARYQTNGSSYGLANGYGNDIYDKQSSPPPPYAAVNRQRSDQDDDAARGALFGGAAKRQNYDEKPQQNPYGGQAAQQPKSYGDDPSRAALLGGAADRQERQGGRSGNPYGDTNDEGGDSSFGGYGSGQALTAEEQEEADIQASKNEIRAVKQATVHSTRNATMVARQALDQGAATLNRLHEQGERIENTRYALDRATIQSDIANQKAADLKRANRSMFNPGARMPGQKNKRLEKALEASAEQRRLERGIDEQYMGNQRDAVNKATADQQRLVAMAKQTRSKTGNPDRSKFQFEADSEDEQMEDEIAGIVFSHLAVKMRSRKKTTDAPADNLDEMSVLAKQLKGQALTLNSTLKQHNENLDALMPKVRDRVRN